MIKLSYDKFMSQGFVLATQKLSSQSFPAQTAYAIKKLVDEMTKWRKRIQEEYITLLKSYAKTDEKGEIVHPDDDPTAFDVPDEKKDDYAKARTEFGERLVEIDRATIPLERLGNVQFSAAELAVLEPVLSEESEPAPVIGKIGKA